MFWFEGDVPAPFQFLAEMQTRNFESSYSCFSAIMHPTEEIRNRVELGDKIIMPPSALNTLARLNVQYPMLFEVSNRALNRSTHCGVLEFVAEEGCVYLPSWMMRNLLLSEGALVHLKNVALPVATHAIFQPQSVDFLEVSNPKAMLEVALRNFTCLTEGDHIVIPYGKMFGTDRRSSTLQTFELLVVELKPESAVAIVECDMVVDFRPPPGYKESFTSASTQAVATTASLRVSASSSQGSISAIPDESLATLSNSLVFSGVGYRLDGKSPTQKQLKEQQDAVYNAAKRNDIKSLRGVADYQWVVGRLHFFRSQIPEESSEAAFEDGQPKVRSTEFKPFQTGGISLREAKKNEQKDSTTR